MDNCIFCKIAAGEIPSTKIYEDELIYAFNDINPEAPVHVVIIPKKHIDSLNDVTEKDNEIISHILLAAKDIAKASGIDGVGYRLVNNCGEDGGQTVKHLHFHLLGGRKFNWPPG
jgi:histidine triad (HIT) family protein